MNVKPAVRLDGLDIKTKRLEIKEYFLSVYESYEKLFEIFIDDTVFYKKSEATRHPMIFYFGHTATFFVNKLLLAGVITSRINPQFESMFAVGVDEMNWDDLNKEHYSWPRVDEVKAYRNEVKALVLELIENIDFTLPIVWESDMWVILMGIEHEVIHIETSSVLHRQLDIEDIKADTNFLTCKEFTKAPINTLVEIKGREVFLGKERKDSLYGWDNEYGKHNETVKDFSVAKFLVSNGEFMEFVLAGGYENYEYWDKEGVEFLEHSKAKHPCFWVKEKNTFRYRSMCEIIDMPLSFPVDVNYLEAKAFLAYKNKKESSTLRLMSEAEWMILREDAKLEEVINSDNANVNFKYFASSMPVDSFKHAKVYDIVGNVFEWSETHMYPYEGFKVHSAYDDFTTPTFDTKHNLIKGASWASCGNELMKHSRYAFRRHFYQHAGFRYVQGEEMSDNDNIYESDALISQYCEFQYGEAHFGVENFAVKCARLATEFSKDSGCKNALDIGCATGRASFELARAFDSVTGIDFSARFINVGDKLKNDGVIYFERSEEGDIKSKHSRSLHEFDLETSASKVEFFQGDACNLQEHFKGYDLVMATNLVDRLYDPTLFLEDVKHRVNEGGYLILTSPYTWLEEYTKKEKWLGGYVDDKGNEVSTLESIKAILADTFECVHVEDVDFVIRETPRKYQHTISQMSVFKKR